jgi:hypothetical protein
MALLTALCRSQPERQSPSFSWNFVLRILSDCSAADDGVHVFEAHTLLQTREVFLATACRRLHLLCLRSGPHRFCVYVNICIL